MEWRQPHIAFSRCSHRVDSSDYTNCSLFPSLDFIINVCLLFPHSPIGKCTRQRSCHPIRLRLTTRTWTRMRSVMTVLLTNAFTMNALHTGYILRLMFQLVYHSLKAVKIYFARVVGSITGQWDFIYEHNSTEKQSS